MSNILIDYMKKRLAGELDSSAKSRTKVGPVVTISREYGCQAKHLAAMLSAELNVRELENQSNNKWKWIGKEILEESAKELNIKPTMVREIANNEQKGVVSDIVLSLSHKYYPGDISIKKKIGEIIHGFAESGHVIIVGRGGVAITKDMPNSLHIKLQAPLEWRINDVSKKQMITLSEAKKKIHHVEEQRDALNQFFTKGKFDNSAFDAIFNLTTLTEDEIIATIIKMMELKDMI